MGFNLGGDDSNDSSGGSPSGTHFYLYEEGHERLPDDEEVSGTIAEAYELAKTQPNGPVRTLANRGWDGGMPHLTAEFVITLGQLMEEESPKPVIDWVMDDFTTEEQVEALAQYMDENQEVGQELAERLQTAEATAPDN